MALSDKKALPAVTIAAILFIWIGANDIAVAEGLLDGQVFEGMIGPAEAPDVDDRLYFDDGHFWSDACTRCGFVPGAYEAEATESGIVFTGVLKSDSRGRFDYRGTVSEDGGIRVMIDWERKRWYWTTRRDIVFQGTSVTPSEPPQLETVLKRMDVYEPDENPACAGF